MWSWQSAHQVDSVDTVRERLNKSAFVYKVPGVPGSRCLSRTPALFSFFFYIPSRAILLILVIVTGLKSLPTNRSVMSRCLVCLLAFT